MTASPSPLSLTDEQGTTHPVHAVIFDKDGTLLDFHASWDVAVGAVLDRLTEGDDAARSAAAQTLGYDLAERRVLPGSPIIAESNDYVIELVRPIVGHLVTGDLGDRFNELVAEIGTTLVAAAAGAADLLAYLQEQNVPIGLATNDSESVARAQLEHLGWTSFFSAIVGYDSGYGAKPEPGMVIGCSTLLDREPHHCLMIGDSTHDLIAATAAGALGVLVGDNPAAIATHAGPRFPGLPGLHRELLPRS